MRISCNGCRVLRKGCSENCIIKPCLDWIKSPQSQSNATLFLAKFYGRAGLLNLINGGPPHLRPSIFRSLLHEACGRMLNPVHGSVGLVSTGSWHLCEEAVEAVLNGSPISEVHLDSGEDHVSSFFSACDIRHVSKNENDSTRAVPKLRNPTRFKRCRVVKPKVEVAELEADSSGVDSVGCSDLVSIETVEDTLVKPIRPELTLGLNLFPILEAHKEEAIKQANEMNGCDADTWTCDLTLGLPPTSVVE